MMAHDILDLTLAAHDPNFPKPLGLLPVPPQVAEQVADEEARILRKFGAPMPPELRQRLLDDWTLRYYYDGAFVAYRRTPEGVEVLAVGWDEASKYMGPRMSELHPGVRVETV
jgi:hypothetical protein